jgi:hypothetical protein
MFIWDKQVKDNKELFDFLMKERLVPEFYKPQLETKEGEKILIPYDKLEKLNEDIMDIFIPNVTSFMGNLTDKQISSLRESVLDKKTGETRLENRINWYWDKAKDRAMFNNRSELNTWK